MGKGTSQSADSAIGAKPYEGDMTVDNKMDTTEDSAMEKAQSAASEAKSGSDD